MATISIDRMEVARTISGNSPQTLSFLEAASQTFKKGDVVSFNVNGYVVVGASNEPRILGVAAEDAHNDSAAGTHSVIVWIACDDTVFRGNSNSTTALLDQGRAFRLTTSSTKWVVDKTSDAGGASLANRRVIVLRLDPRDAVGDTNGRYEFQFHPSYSALAYTS